MASLGKTVCTVLTHSERRASLTVSTGASIGATSGREATAAAAGEAAATGRQFLGGSYGSRSYGGDSNAGDQNESRPERLVRGGPVTVLD